MAVLPTPGGPINCAQVFSAKHGIELNETVLTTGFDFVLRDRTAAM